jgi:hypothetical protein
VIERDIAGLDRTPTKAMAGNAARGLELRRKFGRGGTPAGWARARDIANRANLSDRTILKMHSYFARHAVDSSAPGWGDASDPSAGWIAWLLWGGDSGRTWARVRRDKIMAARKPKRRQRAQATPPGIVTRAAKRTDRQDAAAWAKAQREADQTMIRAWTTALHDQRDRLVARFVATAEALDGQSRLMALPGTVHRVFGIDDIAGLFSVAAEASLIGGLIRTAVESVVKVGWGIFKAVLGDIAWEPTISPAPGLLAEQVTFVNEATKREIEATVREGLTEGKSIGQIQNDLYESQAFSPARALTIARTESSRALNAGSATAYEQAANMGIPLMIEWVKAPIPTLPERSHRRLHGTRVAPGGLFVIESGEDAGASAPFPGKFGIARQDINCRCRTKPILLDDEDED